MAHDTPSRIVIGAATHAEIATLIRCARPDLEIRGAPQMAVTADDLAWADAYVGFRRPPGETMGRVRWVHCTGAGVDAWLYPDALPEHILLTRTSESYGPPIAEWALARALAITQQLRQLDDDQQAMTWAPRQVPLLRGSTVLVVGAGDIGTHVARVFAALGCTVHGVSRHGTRQDPAFAVMHAVDALPSLVATAQWIVVTLPLTRATHHLLSRDVLSACRGAVLLNAGRGAVVEEAALPDALERGWLSALALDVFEQEPLPTSSPLWRDPRVLVSPHISGVTTNEGAAAGFLECLASLERGERPLWAVDSSRGY